MSAENRNNLYNLIMTITTLIFAITSMITVTISLSAWRDERESVRPYLTFNNSPHVFINEAKDIVFAFDFKNVGRHPAASLYCQTIIVDCALDNQLLHKDQQSLLDIILQNTTAELVVKLGQQQSSIDIKHINQHYVVINLKYADPVLDRKHEQIIYLRWAGLAQGRVLPLFHASKEEKDRILSYLSQ